jgi:hypothetical protein
MSGNAPVGPEIWIRGPLATTAPPQTSAPQAEVSAPPQQFSWVGAHGGAGASTLAAALGGFDAGRNWPRVDRGEPGGVLLVARTHAAGLQAASRTLDTFRRGAQPPGVELVAVVLVADAPGRLPRQLAQRIRVIGSATKVHRVPWVATWRTGDLGGPVPRDITALAAMVAAHQTRTS